MSTISQLDFLRLYTAVSCDSYDIDVVRKFGPFVNCTSNQAIIYGELLKETNKAIVAEAAKLAHKHHADKEKCVKYGVRAAMVLLAARLVPHLSGSVLLQSSMYAACSRDETVEDVLEMIRLFEKLSPETSLDRICIKIPATYEGLEACRVLDGKGISTLATCVFSLEQAILASEAKCRFLSPYVNELKVHLTAGMIDEHKLFPVVRQIYEYYEDHGISTKIVSASFVSPEEVLQISGIHGVTLPPLILQEMASTMIPVDTTPSYPVDVSRAVKTPEPQFLGEEQTFKDALNANKEAVRKLQEAIAFFLGIEKQLESIIENALQQLD